MRRPLRKDKPGFLDLLMHLDLVLLGSTFALSVLGILMVYAVTRPQASLFGVSPTHFVYRQIFFVFLGSVVALIILLFDYKRYFSLIPALYGLSIASLLGVFVLGHHALGAQRWFQLGPLQVQPSEFAILAMVLIVAHYLSERESPKLRELISVCVLSGVPILLVYKQPDLGTAIVMGITLLVMIVFAGFRLRYVLLILMLLVFGVYAVLQLGLLKQYQIERLTSFVNSSSSAKGANYNLQQSEDAIGSGGLFGKGYLRGAETNLAFVPEQQTDFIFTAIGEQLGFIGSIFTVGLFGLLVFRLIRAISLARDRFGMLLCAGTAAVITFSAFQNAGMTMGLMPITGIPLPFVSYGGSSLLLFFALVSLVLNIEMRRHVSKTKPLKGLRGFVRSR